jgi:hypothetical protein
VTLDSVEGAVEHRLYYELVEPGGDHAERTPRRRKVALDNVDPLLALHAILL